MTDQRYQQRGVSAGKEDVHHAIANLDTIAGGRNRGASAGGSLIFQTSAAAGAGVTGTLTTRLTINGAGEIIPVLPTSAAGLSSGALWNNLGVVSVAP
ncbi:MAG: hypothetical protein EBV19_00075 [Flavobacteriia bacterium]|nr:hypothetical protein [Flavobacteriia bacterium]